MGDHLTGGPAGATSRRGVLAVAGAAGVGAALAACGGSDGGGNSADGSGDSGDTGNPGGTAAAGAGAVLGKVADIPVGGGKVFKPEKTVVTQPTAGDFKGFSAVCTHQGCLVNDVADGMINCGCHGSQFAISDGAVKRAAPGMTTSSQKPLPARQVTVRDGDIVLG